MNTDISIEEGEFGERLVLHQEWKDEYIGYMLDHNISELNVNYARGFKGDSLDFLQNLPFLTGLLLIVYNVPDTSVIHNLKRLRALNIGTRDKTPLDFAQFPLLEDCGMDWRAKSESIFQCTKLKRLFISKYSAKNTDGFGSLSALKELYFSAGPVADLTGLSPLQGLEKLGLYYLRSLSSLEGIQSLTRLEELRIETCRKIDQIDEVRDLKNLRRLTIANCGDIASLRPIDGLSELDRLYFYESTNILDGDLSSLTRLKKLSDVRFMNRKHYSQKREEFPPFDTDSRLKGKALIEALQKVPPL